MLDNVLFLSVHRDDECLSAGGTLMQCEKLHINYFNNHHPNVADEIYDREAETVQRALGCTVSYSTAMDVNHLAEYAITTYISEIEALINEHHPTTLIIPHPSYNQDHRVVYEAALTASRVHDTNWYVNTILTAEQPETHTPSLPYFPFIPHVYIPISMGMKTGLYALYASQIRDHRSFDHIICMAKVRGMQCHTEFAEAFMVVRHTWQ